MAGRRGYARLTRMLDQITDAQLDHMMRYGASGGAVRYGSEVK